MRHRHTDRETQTQTQTDRETQTQTQSDRETQTQRQTENSKSESLFYTDIYKSKLNNSEIQAQLLMVIPSHEQRAFR